MIVYNKLHTVISDKPKVVVKGGGRINKKNSDFLKQLGFIVNGDHKFRNISSKGSCVN